jgi:hypothetical protein
MIQLVTVGRVFLHKARIAQQVEPWRDDVDALVGENVPIA